MSVRLLFCVELCGEKLELGISKKYGIYTSVVLRSSINSRMLARESIKVELWPQNGIHV